MATNVAPGANKNGEAAQPKANVKEIKDKWSVYEDGALAYKLQEEENVTHYSGNISRRRTVRSDIRTAKTAAEEEAINAFREEHDIAARNHQIEMEDAETAKKLLHEMMEEEKRKLREERQRHNEAMDREAAKELQRQMMEEEKCKVVAQQSFQETDAELAIRLQAHEERKRQILSRKQHSLDHEKDDERFARQLAREEQRNLYHGGHQERVGDGKRHHRNRREDASYGQTDNHRPSDSRENGRDHRSTNIDKSKMKCKSLEATGYTAKLRQISLTEDMDRQKHVKESRPSQLDKPLPSNLGEHRPDHVPVSTDINKMKSRSLDARGYTARLQPVGLTEETVRHKLVKPRERKQKANTKDYLVPDVVGLTVAEDEGPLPDLPVPPRKHRQRGVPRQQSAPAEFVHGDSDEETDIIAKIKDDEELARRLQREEIQKSRVPAPLTEKERKQLINDKKIAIKMQHEEVMFSRKSTYDNYMGKVKDEIADPEPMVHVNRQNKTAIPADAKFADGVQLTDYTSADVAKQRRASGGAQAASADGNILASVDPTFNRSDTGNVVLIKKTPLPEEPASGGDSVFNPVQGSKRKESKDKGRKGSILNKLKKK